MSVRQEQSYKGVPGSTSGRAPASDALDWNKGNGLIPAIIQDADSRKVLMLGYMNEESLEKTKREGKVNFYSRSREQLWMKGETSGNTLQVMDIQVDCDNDALLVLCKPEGPTCHTGAESCFSLAIDSEVVDACGLKNADDCGLDFLEDTLKERIASLKEGNVVGYTGGLYSQNEDRLLKKIAEEAGEVILAAKGTDLEALVDECADLVFHMEMILVSKGLSFADIRNRLKKRSSNT